MKLTKRQISLRLNRAVAKTNDIVAAFAREGCGCRAFVWDKRDKDGFCFFFDDPRDENYRSKMNPLEEIVETTWVEVLKQNCEAEGLDFGRLHLNHKHRLPGMRGVSSCWGLGIFNL